MHFNAVYSYILSIYMFFISLFLCSNQHTQLDLSSIGAVFELKWPNKGKSLVQSYSISYKHALVHQSLIWLDSLTSCLHCCC